MKNSIYLELPLFALRNHRDRLADKITERFEQNEYVREALEIVARCEKDAPFKWHEFTHAALINRRDWRWYPMEPLFADFLAAVKTVYVKERLEASQLFAEVGITGKFSDPQWSQPDFE